MAQKTAKSVEDVLEWIETTSHHFASWDEEPGFFVLKGYGEKLRVPEAIQKKTRALVMPGREFDGRMFRATASGRKRLQRARARAVQP